MRKLKKAAGTAVKCLSKLFGFDDDALFVSKPERLEVRRKAFEGPAEVRRVWTSHWDGSSGWRVRGQFYPNVTADNAFELVVKYNVSEGEYHFLFFGTSDNDGSEDLTSKEKNETVRRLLAEYSCNKRFYVKGEEVQRKWIAAPMRPPINIDAYTGIIEVDDVPAYSFEIDLNGGERRNVIKKLA